MKNYQKIQQKFKQWLEQKSGLAALTQYCYWRTAQGFLSYLEEFGILRLNDVDPVFLAQFLQTRKVQSYALSSIKFRIAALHLFFSWAHQHRYCAHQPMVQYKQAKVTIRRLDGTKANSHFMKTTTLLSHQEQQTLLHLPISTDFLDIRNQCIVLLLLASGLSAEELRTLAWRDCHLDKGYVWARGEHRHARRVPLQLDLCQRSCRQWLKLRAQVLGTQRHPLLFFTQSFKPLSKRLLYKIVAEYLAQAGINKKPTGPEVLRQTAICNMFRNKKTLEGIQRHTGILTLSVLTHYQQLAAESL